MRKKAFFFLGNLLYACLLACMFIPQSMAQPTPPAGTVSPMVTRNGFSLQKATSLSSAKTGEIFTYTITFSIPAGTGAVTIGDLVPAPLAIDSVIIPPGGYVGVPSPAVNINTATNTVTINFPSVPVSITGSFQINVHFPVTNTCPGMAVANSAFLSAAGVELKTEDILVSANINNPWKIRKRQDPALLVNNTCQPLTTTYGTTSTTVRYTVDITKTNAAVIGSASLYNVSLQDLLPTGATVIPGASQSPQLTTSLNVPTCNINSSGLISFSTPLVLDATTNPLYTFTFSVVHNNLASSNCEVNRMVLRGNYLCNDTLSAQYRDTARVGVRLIPEDLTVTTLAKTVTVSGNVPGCTGTYKIRVRNLGPGTLHEYVLRDTFPACLIAGSYTPPAGCSITIVSPTGSSPVIFELRANPGTFLPPPPPAQFHDYFINFTIGNNCLATVSNTVWGDSIITGKSTRNFPMLPNVVKPCITKQICGTTTSYSVGDLVRFRIRIQNLGAMPLVGVNVTDSLDMANLEYIGAESYYFTNSLVNNQPCGLASNWQSHISTLNNTGSTNLLWNIDTIPVECGSVANTVCGQGNSLRAYYIEFTVKIKDTAGIGNILNIASIQGGNIQTAVADDVSFVVNGNLNYGINKQVSSDGGSTFAQSTTVAAGGTAHYQLSCTNLGIPLVTPMILDLLPRDNIGGSVADNYILASTVRGSNMDVRYGSLFMNSHSIAASGQFYSTGTGISTTTELGTTVNTAAPGWGTTAVTGTANFKTYFSQAIGTTPAFNYIFTGIVDPQATADSRACNTFAIRGFGKYLINYNASLVQQPPVESGRACVIATKAACCDPVDVQIPKEVCLGFAQQFCAIDTCNTNQYFWDFGDGTPVITGNCVSHTYSTAGVFSVKLIWKNPCGERSEKYEISVKECPCDIKANALITANGNSITADAGSTISSLPIVLYVWDFGDGSIATGQVVTHSYAVAGNYTVTLTAYSITPKGEVCECIDRCRTDIFVNPRILDNQFTCGIVRKDAKIRSTEPAISNSKINIKATPNPFSNQVQISFSVPVSEKLIYGTNYSVDFASNNGTVLHSKPIVDFNKSVSFQTSQYPSGSYIIMLKNKAGQIQSIKVIKLK